MKITYSTNSRQDFLQAKKKFSTTTHAKLIATYSERIEIAVDFVYCYVTGLLLGNMQTDISSTISERIEEKCFDYFSRMLKTPINDVKKVIRDRFGEILGMLSLRRFAEISTKFFAVFEKTKFENGLVVPAMRFLKILLDSNVNITKGAKFMQQMWEYTKLKFKSDFKMAIYEVMANMLSPLAGYEQKNNVDFSEWNTQVTNFLQLSKGKTKAKYYMSEFPLFSTILSLRYDESMLEYFHPLVDTLIKFLPQKKNLRLMAIDCLIHILGFYLKVSESTDDGKLKDIVNDKLTKFLTSPGGLLPMGKRVFPKEENNDQYESIVDVICMVSHTKLDMAIVSLILESLKTDVVVSENVLIGLRAFMAIAEEHDVEMISPIVEEEQKKMVRYPSWMFKLIQKSEKGKQQGTFRSETEFENEKTIRVISSPFSSLNSFSSRNSFSSVSMKRKVKLGMNLHLFEDEVSKVFSNVLRELDKQLGAYTISQIGTKGNINDLFSKDKMYSFIVFATALSAISQLLPNGYTAFELTEMLTRCTIHQHKEIRDISWQVLVHLMEFHPPLRVVIIHSFCELISSIHDYKVNLLEGVLSRMIFLLNKWVEYENKKQDEAGPTVYAKLAPFKERFSIPRLESTAIVLLCNISESVRSYGLQVIFWTKKVAQMLLEKGELEDVPTTLQDLFEECEKIITDNVLTQLTKRYQTKKSAYSFKNIEDMNMKLKQDYTLLLKEIAILSSNYCGASSRNAVIKLFKKIPTIGSIDPSTKITTIMDSESLDFWRNMIVFACSTVFGEVSKDVKKSSDISTPKDLYDNILLNLKSSNDSQITLAVNALGGVNQESVEILLDTLLEYEADAYQEKRKVNKKIKQSLRQSIARIYSKLSEEMSEGKFKERDYIKERFINFVIENFKDIKTQTGNIEYQVLRYHFFTVLAFVSKNLHYYPPRESLKVSFDIKLREELFKFCVTYTGFGEESKKREQVEQASLDQFLATLKTPEEKSFNESTFKKVQVKVQDAATQACIFLLLGKFMDDKKSELKDWSIKTRKITKTTEKLEVIERKDEKRGSHKSINPNIPINLAFFRKSDAFLTPIPKKDAPESTASFGVQIWSWLDCLCTINPALAIQSISNILETNFDLVDILVDQCYQCNTSISKCTFFAIVETMILFDFPCSLPSMIGLILFFSKATQKEVRDKALLFLNILSSRCDQNYSYYVSGDLLDSCDDLQMHLSTKLAKDFASLSNEIIKEVFGRLPFLSEASQRSMIAVLVPWIANVRLKLPNILKIAEVETDEREVIISILYDITFMFSEHFPGECKNLWITLGGEETNVPIVVSFMINKSCKVENSSSILSISQKITRYLSLVAASSTLFVLTEEFTKFKNNLQIEYDYEKMISEPQLEDRLPLFAPHEFALVLLVGVTYDLKTELAKYLELILQVSFILMDHSFPIIFEAAKSILTNLLNNFVIRVLPPNGNVQQMEHLFLAQELIKFIQAQKGYSLWKNDLESIVIYSYDTILWVLENALKAFSLEESIKTRWGAEALKWAITSRNPHNVIRSYQIYRTIKPSVRPSDILDIASNIKFYLTNSFERKSTQPKVLEPASRVSFNSENRPNDLSPNMTPVPIRDKDVMVTSQTVYTPPHMLMGLGFNAINEPNNKEKIALNEIISTLREMIRSIDKKRLILYPQLFWIVVSLLQTDYIILYRNSLTLLLELLEKSDISDFCLQSVLLANCPQKSDTPFAGIQPLVIRGLFHSFSEPLAIQVLAYSSILPCDALFNVSGSRLLMNILALLPFLCNHISDELAKKCFKIATNLSESCEGKCKKIGKVFLRYSKGHYSTSEKFLLELRKPLCEAFFSQFENEIFAFLQNLLENGPLDYQKSVIMIIHSLALYIDVSKTNVYQKDSFNFVNSLMNMTNSNFYQDVTRVMDVAVKMSSKNTKIKIAPGSSNPAPIKKIIEFSSNSSDGNRKLIEMLDLLGISASGEKIDLKNVKTTRVVSDLKTKIDFIENAEEMNEDSSEGISEGTLDSESTMRIAYSVKVDEKEEKFINQFNESLKKHMSQQTRISPYPKI